MGMGNSLCVQYRISRLISSYFSRVGCALGFNENLNVLSAFLSFQLFIAMILIYDPQIEFNHM
jgi:hypothetical protein